MLPKKVKPDYRPEEDGANAERFADLRAKRREVRRQEAQRQQEEEERIRQSAIRGATGERH